MQSDISMKNAVRLKFQFPQLLIIMAGRSLFSVRQFLLSRAYAHGHRLQPLSR
jgi:hypothetical protein